MEAQILEIKLMGGLGNQLHGVAAGIALSELKKVPVKFDASQIPYGSNPTRRLSVQNLDLGFSNLKFENSAYSPLLGYIFFAGSKARIPIRNLLKVEESVWSDQGQEPKTAMKSIPDSGRIEGHFLDFEWAEIASKNGMKFLGLRQPLSKKAEELFNSISSESIAIHARFGDYKKNSLNFPLLDLDFYLRALSNFDDVSERWLFTDDIKSARKILGARFLAESKLVPTAGVTDIESFFLLSNFKKIITSNSTFSSWAAYFAEKNWSAKVVTPVPHMYGDWQDRLPQTWRRVEI